jgi:hypothetical protein
VTHFGVHIYGNPQQIKFTHLSWLTDAPELPRSLALAEAGELPEGWDEDSTPGIRYKGDWDSRPHPARVIQVDRRTLALWVRLVGDDVPVDQAKLLSPVSSEEQDAIERLANYPMRLGDFDPQATLGVDETAAKRSGIIEYNPMRPDSWSQVVLRGIQIGLANPMFKSPDANSNDPFGLALLSMATNEIPETDFRISDPSRYEESQEKWVDRRSGLRKRYTAFYRLAWRRQIAPNTERSLYAALIPPGPAHVDLMNSLVLADNRSTVLAAGFWSSLVLDYFLRVTGKSDLRAGAASTMPFGELSHPLASALMLRTMRLNCVTSVYANLWEDVYDSSWSDDTWAGSGDGLPSMGDVARVWGRNSPLRTERARRSALVEIDALVAVWLGMDADALIAIYEAAFPVLNRYEAITWFDANGSKLAGYHRTYGQYQQKDSWNQFEAYLDEPSNNPPPDGYEPPFYRADRIGEYRRAHAAFTERMQGATS